MANRYWVGGNGTWNSVNTANWSDTSGGAGGASVPTVSDDVFFDANSSGICTAGPIPSGIKSLNCSGFTGTITGSGGIQVGGSMTLASGMTYNLSGEILFFGTGTLTTAGKSLSSINIFSPGITVTLADALTAATSITVTQGELNTAGYAVTTGTLSSSSSNTRAISLGASTVNLDVGVDFGSSGGLTFNAGTSQINISSGGPTFNGNSSTFYNVAFTNTGAGTVVFISGTNTFNDLTVAANTSGITRLTLGGNQTVSGVFTCAGSTAINRNVIFSSTLGTARTVTAAAVSANNCDFRDITIAGAAAPIAPTGAGDCGGNSGITFPAAKTVYRVGTSTTWTGSSSWALSSGGTGNNNNFPLAQDTAVIDNATTLTGTLSLSLGYNYPALDASTRTTGITLSFNQAVDRYGSLLLGSGITIGGTSNTQTFAGRGTMVLASAGKTITFAITVNARSGTLQLGDALTSSAAIILTSGTLDANNYNITCTTFTSSNTVTRTIKMGSGLWTLSGTGTVWTTATVTGLTFSKDTANILLSNTTTTARTFSGGNLSYNKLTIGGATGTSTLTLTGNDMSFTELASTKTVAHTIRLSTNLATIDTWSITGTAGNVVTLNSTSTGTRRTFNLTNSTLGTVDYMAVQDIGVNQAATFYVGDNSTNNGNNLNVIFSSIPVPASTGNMFMLFQ